MISTNRIAVFALSATLIAVNRVPLQADDSDLAARLAAAQDDATVHIEAGTYTAPLATDRPLTLQGTSVDNCILKVAADRPALSFTGKGNVLVDSLTIKWQLESSQPDPGTATAVFVKDAQLTLRNCHIVALGNGNRCPSGVMADGFSQVTLENCTVEGFEFAINVSGGAEGIVSDCVVRRPGHCGLSVFSGSTLTVTRCIVAESAYHGLRSTGGTLTATDNLIVRNKNRGIYLGNKSAKAAIRGNVLFGNTTGISSFAQTEGTLERNIILESEYAAIDSRDTCALTIKDNILQGNERGFVLFAESGRNRVSLESNTFWNNRTDTENVERPPGAVLADPQFADPQQGRFTPTSEQVLSARHGLADGEPIARLWSRWQALSNLPAK